MCNVACWHHISEPILLEDGEDEESTAAESKLNAKQNFIRSTEYYPRKSDEALALKPFPSRPPSLGARPGLTLVKLPAGKQRVLRWGFPLLII